MTPLILRLGRNRTVVLCQNLIAVINRLILPSDDRRVIAHVELIFAGVSIPRSRLQWSRAGRLGKHRRPVVASDEPIVAIDGRVCITGQAIQSA